MTGKKFSLMLVLWFGLLQGIYPVFAAEPVAAGAAAVPQVQAETKTTVFTRLRSSQNVEKTRIVLDLSSIPEYTVEPQGDGKQLTVTLKNTALSGISPVYTFKDNLVKQVMAVSAAEKEVKIVIDLAYSPHYEIYRLNGPPRLVIDFWKVFEQKTEQQLAAGLNYTAIRKATTDGPLSIHILDYDLKNPQLKLEHVLAKDFIVGTETVRSMSMRKNALAAVNGTYFSPSGELLGLIVQDGQIMQNPVNERSAFALTYAGDMLLDQVSYAGELVLPDGNECELDAVNRERGPDALVLYTPAYGASTRTNKYGTEYVVVEGKVSQISTGNTAIPPNGFVVSGHGAKDKALAALKVGDPLSVKHALTPDWSDVRLAVGAGPQLVRDGTIYLTTKTEGFGSDVAGGRAPRTAVGMTAQGRMLLVVVDGRQPGYSVGMTLLEMGKLLQSLGAVNALNLDGGGSAEMVVNGVVVNQPSDGRERPVGDALLVVPAVRK
ncbi:MAG: phosphodiester glycosidase family protein [Bacillota bacterium]